jgi:circadian clock protein KaiC
MFIFEASISCVVTRSESLGMPLAPLIEQGLVTITQVDPAQLQPGEFAHKVRAAVENEKARVVVIDSLNGFLNAVPEERFLLLHLHELLSYLGQNGVATILVFAQHGLVGHMQTSVDVSYLADSVILLRYFEADGRIHKAISIVKKRTGRHETAIRSLTMGSDGLTIGPPLTNYRGVMSGIPNYDATVGPARDV